MSDIAERKGMGDDIVHSLQTLCHPTSEFLPDGKRLTLLIQRGQEAADEITRLRADLAAALSSGLTMAELRLAEKHCDWPAFKCAFNAVMKARRAAQEDGNE